MYIVLGPSIFRDRSQYFTMMSTMLENLENILENGKYRLHILKSYIPKVEFFIYQQCWGIYETYLQIVNIGNTCLKVTFQR